MTSDPANLEFHGGPVTGFLPFAIFLICCVSFFVVFQVYDMTALGVGGYIALLIGSVVAKQQSAYWDAVLTGMSSKMINTLVLIFVLVGIFAKMIANGGVPEAFIGIAVNLDLTGSRFTAFAFFICCMISMASGTSFGTLFSGFPILYPTGVVIGADPTFLAGAIMSGALFGDNLAPISDTTIASASSQRFRGGASADVGGVVLSRLKYCLPAALIAFLGFLFFGGASEEPSAQNTATLQQNIDLTGAWLLLALVVLLFTAFKTRNIFVAVTWGLITGVAIGLTTGLFTLQDILSVENGGIRGFTIEGLEGMLGTIIFVYAIAGIMGVLDASGFLQLVLRKLLALRLASTARGVETLIFLGITFCNICLGGAAGAAILMFAPMAEKLGQSQSIHPYRRANILDCNSFTIGAIVPITSAYIFVCISLSQQLARDYDFIPTLNPLFLSFTALHCWALLLVMIFAIYSGWGRRYESDNELVR